MSRCLSEFLVNLQWRAKQRQYKFGFSIFCKFKQRNQYLFQTFLSNPTNLKPNLYFYNFARHCNSYFYLPLQMCVFECINMI